MTSAWRSDLAVGSCPSVDEEPRRAPEAGRYFSDRHSPRRKYDAITDLQHKIITRRLGGLACPCGHGRGWADTASRVELNSSDSLGYGTRLAIRASHHDLDRVAAELGCRLAVRRNAAPARRESSLNAIR